MARTFYVDSNAGSDSNSGTSAGAAWRSLDKVEGFGLQPGDTVLFARGGTWNDGLSLRASGTSAAPITFGAYGSGADPVFANARNGFYGNGHDNIVIKDIQIKNMSGAGIFTEGSANWIIDRVTIDRTGQGHDGSNREFAGVQLWGSQNITVQNSTLINVRGDVIWGWEVDGLKILNNKIYTPSGSNADNVHLYAPTNYEIRGNWMSMEGQTDSGKGNIHSQAGNGGVIAGNELRGGNYGVGVTDSNMLVENNFLVGHNQAGWASAILISEVYDVQNNTFRGNIIKDANIGFYSYQNYARDNFRFENNTFIDFQRTALLNEGRMSGSFTGNKAWSPASGDAIEWHGSGSFSYSNNAYGPGSPPSEDRGGATLTAAPTYTWAGPGGATPAPTPTPTPDQPLDLVGTAGADTLTGKTAADKITGGKGNDVMTGGGGHDTFVIAAGDGADTITDFMGNNDRPWVNAAESDTIRFVGAGLTAANLRILQDNEDLLLTFDGAPGTSVRLKGVWTDALDNDPARSPHGLIFDGQSAVSDSFDTLKWNTQATQVWRANTVTFLTDQDNTIRGLDGSNDVINGHGGNDVISGLGGNDILRGDAGNDTLDGGAGDDRLDGGAGDDVLIGGAGIDTAVFAGRKADYAITFGANGAVTVKDLTAKEGTDTLTGVEKAQFSDGMFDLVPPAAGGLTGTAGNDTLAGTKADETITGGKGNDVMTGGGGHDTFVINAGDGTDTLKDFMGNNDRPWVTPAESDTVKFVGAGLTAANMRLFQDGENLVVSFDGVANTKLILEKVWTDALDNGAGGYGFIFDGQSAVSDSFDTLKWNTQATQVWRANTVTFLTDQDNTIRGLDGSNDVINGHGGNDVISGLGGNDVLRGDAGNDTLNGGAGNDRLDGGSGSDRLTGGTGADTFVFARGYGQDTVTDFRAAQGDKLDLSAFGLGSMAALQAAATITAGTSSVTLDFGQGDRLTVLGLSNLTATNVVF